MAIGRLYFYAVSIALCMFYCTSHCEPWPEQSWKPHHNWGNREVRAEEEKRRKKEEARLEEAKENASKNQRKVEEEVVGEKAFYVTSPAGHSGDGGKKRKRDRVAVPRREDRRGSERGKHGSRSGGRKPSAADKYFDETKEIKPTQRWR